MTNHWNDMKNAYCFLVFSNPVENHPSCTQWINEAIENNGAKVIVAEPRRTRMTALADQYLRFRPGTDIAFISGILKIFFDKIDSDGQTAAYIASGNDKIPPGKAAYLRAIQAVAKNPNWFHDVTTMTGMYWPKWTDALFRTNEGYSAPAGEPTDYLRYGRDIDATVSSTERDSDPNYADPTGWLRNPANQTWANQNQIPVLAPDLNPSSGSMTVYQAYKARVAAYDSSTVADICGGYFTAQEFEDAVDTYLSNSWAYTHEDSGEVASGIPGVNKDDGSSADPTNYKAATILYAMGTTQHTHGSQNVKAYANLQICTGNIGKHGGGVNALRGISNVQGSTDMNLLYHILMAYVAVPYKVKIVQVNSPTQVVVSGKASLWLHNFSSNNTELGYAGNYDSTQPEVCCRVLLGDQNGFLKAGAPTYSYSSYDGSVKPTSGCGTPVIGYSYDSVNDQTTITTADSLGAPAAGDYLFVDYETWLYSKSFGGRNVYPSGGGNANYPNGWSFSGGLPWGHQGTWAVIRTFFSEGYGSNVGGTVGDGANAASAATLDLYNNYLPKGKGMDHRTMVNQTGTTGDPNPMPGYDSSKPKVTGMVVWGMNPRVTVGNATNVGEALENLDWLLVVDMFINETADADRKTDAPTYFLPAASFAETAGTLTTSGRWIQWRYQGIPPKSGCRTDLEILFKLARALHIHCGLTFGYGSGQTAYEKIWRDQYAGDGSTSGILQGVGDAAFQAATGSLPDPAVSWDNDAYRASYEGEDNGIGNAGLGYPGYAERIMIQTNTNSNDTYGNAGCNWLHGSKNGGGGKYGAWHDPSETDGAKMLDQPTDNPGYTPHADDALANRTQARSPNDSQGNKGVYPGWAWAWLRNRRCFYNKGGFCPGDIGDIFVSPDEVGTMFMGVPGYTNRPPVVQYTGCWRGSRNLKGIPINSADRVWSKLGYTPVHWEPHESPRADLVATYAQIGKESVEDYADTDTEREEYPLVLTTFRHTEHFQGGPMSRNVPRLIELVPDPVIEINSYDADLYGIKDGYSVYVHTKRVSNLGPFKAKVGVGEDDEQRVGKGVVAVPWHWGSNGLATGPTANEATIDALDGNTNMPETKVCLCKITTTGNPYPG